MIDGLGAQVNWVHDCVGDTMPPVLQRRACYGASAPWLQDSAGRESRQAAQSLVSSDHVVAVC